MPPQKKENDRHSKDASSQNIERDVFHQPCQDHPAPHRIDDAIELWRWRAGHFTGNSMFFGRIVWEVCKKESGLLAG